MRHLINFDIKYILSNYTLILFSLIVIVGCHSNNCGNFDVELKKDNIRIYMDTSLLSLRYDSMHSYLEPIPYIIRLKSNSEDVIVFIYVGSQDDISNSVDVYDLEEKFGPVEQQFQDKPWIKYIDKGRLNTNNSIFYFVEYFSDKTNWIQAQMTYNSTLLCHIIIMNNDLQNANQKYVNTVKLFLKSICFKNQ